MFKAAVRRISHRDRLTAERELVNFSKSNDNYTSAASCKIIKKKNIYLPHSARIYSVFHDFRA